jgi:hypothetical protein
MIELQECINNKNNSSSSYEKGKIFATFSNDVTNSEISDLIKKYDLSESTIFSLSEKKIVYIIVPYGEEPRWSCILESSPIVLESGLSNIVETASVEHTM